jgi:hypothetical protein
MLGSKLLSRAGAAFSRSYILHRRHRGLQVRVRHDRERGIIYDSFYVADVRMASIHDIAKNQSEDAVIGLCGTVDLLLVLVTEAYRLPTTSSVPTTLLPSPSPHRPR